MDQKFTKVTIPNYTGLFHVNGARFGLSKAKNGRLLLELFSNHAHVVVERTKPIAVISPEEKIAKPSSQGSDQGHFHFGEGLALEFTLHNGAASLRVTPDGTFYLKEARPCRLSFVVSNDQIRKTATSESQQMAATL